MAGYIVGSFILAVLFPWIFLRLASRPQTPRGKKIALAVVGWSIGVFVVFAGLVGGGSLNLGHLLALFFAAWLTWRAFRPATPRPA